MMNPLLMIDFYKATHDSQYPKGLTKLVSYYTPRMSRLKDNDQVTFFYLQAFIKRYLIEAFNEGFFNRPEEEVVEEYKTILDATLGDGAYNLEKIRSLHQLGYLPLMISAVPEGIRTKVGVPQIEITNTHPDFVWLVNTIETMLSCTLWHAQVSAEVGYRYRKIVEKYHAETCDENIRVASLLGDFSMRGQHSVESAMKSSGGWLLSFLNTATVPAIVHMNQYYNTGNYIPLKDIGRGAISTEHSVMCSNYAVDGDEITHIKRLLTEIYPNHNFSMVSDSYDYDNLVENILPQCKTEILTHNGTLSIRGDSGNPIEVIAGIPYCEVSDEDWNWIIDDAGKWAARELDEPYEEASIIVNHKGRYHKITIYPVWTWDNMIEHYNVVVRYLEKPGVADMGTVWALDQIFGHMVNSKGYKVLNTHIKAIYGDSITPERCEEIYKRLEQKGYAINNVSLGVGSFSFMCLGTDNPYTRDTFGIAVKATYGEDADGNPVMIYKNPKNNSWKKSQKGCCVVAPDGQGYEDGLTWEEMCRHEDNLLKMVFCDGELVREWNLDGIRSRLHNGNF